MRGATDGGKHIEGMRTSNMKSGYCQLKATGCEGYVQHLERHHEKYLPERTILVCHHCHHLLHFRPYHLTERIPVSSPETPPSPSSQRSA